MIIDQSTDRKIENHTIFLKRNYRKSLRFRFELLTWRLSKIRINKSLFWQVLVNRRNTPHYLSRYLTEYKLTMIDRMVPKLGVDLKEWDLPSTMRQAEVEHFPSWLKAEQVYSPSSSG